MTIRRTTMFPNNMTATLSLRSGAKGRQGDRQLETARETKAIAHEVRAFARRAGRLMSLTRCACDHEGRTLRWASRTGPGSRS
jgi:hypothetical protein